MIGCGRGRCSMPYTEVVATMARLHSSWRLNTVVKEFKLVTIHSLNIIKYPHWYHKDIAGIFHHISNSTAKIHSSRQGCLSLYALHRYLPLFALHSRSMPLRLRANLESSVKLSTMLKSQRGLTSNRLTWFLAAYCSA